MALNYDIALQNNDLYFQNGDLVIAESDQQHIVDTINAFPGWWKENVLDGVGVFSYMKAPSSLGEIRRKVKIELQSDGYVVDNPEVTLDERGELYIDPKIIVE